MKGGSAYFFVTTMTEHILQGHTAPVRDVCVLSDNSRIVSTSSDYTLRVWNINTGLCERTLSVPDSTHWSLCALPDGYLASGSNAGVIIIWNINTGTADKILKGHTGLVDKICLLPDGRIVSASWDRTLRVWNLETGVCEKILTGHTNAVTSLCVLNDGKRIVSGSRDNSLRVFNVDSDSVQITLNGHSSAISDICVLSDDRIVSSSYDRTSCVWDLRTGSIERVRVEEPVSSIIRMVALRDGSNRVMSAASGAMLHLWNADDGSTEQTFSGHRQDVWALCTAGKGHIVSASMDNTLRLWKI